MNARGAKSTGMTWLGGLRALVVLGYAALFAWQLAVGKEAGFTVFGARGLRPVLLAGGPWLYILSSVQFRFLPADAQIDLTVLNSRTLVYDAIVLASFAINAALISRFLSWYEQKGREVDVPPARAAEPTPRNGTARRRKVVFAYVALFVWQFFLGTVTGKEAGFLVYGPLALLPTFIAGAPWFWVLLGFLKWVSPTQADLTAFTAETVLYHAIVLVSFAINAAVIGWLPDWLDRRLGPRRGR